jgi:hypothetical protein
MGHTRTETEAASFDGGFFNPCLLRLGNRFKILAAYPAITLVLPQSNRISDGVGSFAADMRAPTPRRAVAHTVQALEVSCAAVSATCYVARRAARDAACVGHGARGAVQPVHVSWAASPSSHTPSPSSLATQQTGPSCRGMQTRWAWRAGC